MRDIMKTYITAAFSASLAVWYCVGQEPTSVHRPQVTLQTVIHVQNASSDSPVRDLLRIGALNDLPLGIVIGSDGTICRGDLRLSTGDMTVAALLDKVNDRIPGYHGELSDGVIDVTATKLSPGGAELLRMVLPDFKSGRRGTYKLVAFWLWTYVRAVIAPQDGTAYVGADSTQAEMLEPFELKQTSVKHALNRITSQGTGAAWVFHDPNVSNLTRDTQMPFRIYGYTGDPEALYASGGCPN
jgi:hypothetical protein